MDTTEIIKQKEVRKFLLENFPKPLISTDNIEEKISPKHNQNPSLTGNAFEFFLRILSSTTYPNIENEFKYELSRAISNLERTKKKSNNREPCRGHFKIYLNENEYRQKIKEIRKIFNKRPSLINEVSRKFEYVIIENVKDISISDKIKRETGFYVADIFHTALILRGKSLPYYTIIVNTGSLSAYIEKIIANFKKECGVFIQKRKLGKEFVQIIMEFVQISSQFYRSLDVIKGLHFEEGYIESVFNLFKVIHQKKDFRRKIFLHKPSLKLLGILSTPDFLLDDKILEIKTSKDFFSTNDYLQTLYI